MDLNAEDGHNNAPEGKPSNQADQGQDLTPDTEDQSKTTSSWLKLLKIEITGANFTTTDTLFSPKGDTVLKQSNKSGNEAFKRIDGSYYGTKRGERKENGDLSFLISE